MSQKFENSVPQELRIDAAAVVSYLQRRLKTFIFEHSETHSAVIGLSGGVDSSVVAALTLRAVSSRNVRFYYLPSKSTSNEDEEDMAEFAKWLKIPAGNLKVVKIDEPVRLLGKAVGANQGDRLLLGNVKARVRMILLHAFAQKHKALVIGTGDKSEITIGYFTKFGDGGVDVLPIGDLYKSQVRLLAAHLGLPARIYQKPPSPGLWTGQSAETELGMDYFLLDRILFHRFDLWEDEESIAESLSIPRVQVERIMRKVRRTQHKRYPPEVFKLSFRAHGSDWRYPREWMS